jgi:molybdopterin converting factor small subunit
VTSHSLTILLFAGLKEVAGRSSFEIPFREGLTVCGLRTLLKGLYPTTQSLLERSKIAVNDHFVEETTFLKVNDELAIIPPVSGGIWLS